VSTAIKLGFHYHLPALQDGAGRVLMPGMLGRFVDGLASECNRVICFLHSPGTADRTPLDYAISAENVALIDIGPHVSIPLRTLRQERSAEALRTRTHDLDVMLVRAPTPLVDMVARAAGTVPLALLIVGDYMAGVDDLPQPRWRKELIRAWCWWNSRQQLRVARRALTFVNNHRLFGQLEGRVPHLVETRTTTLTGADFFARPDTCAAEPFRLLFTGRLDRQKGLEDIVRAMAILDAQGVSTDLGIAGWEDSRDPVLERALGTASSLGLAGRVRYLGFKPVGEALFEVYRQADVFVTASQASEGFPRTIWEAMAQSLPVVATRVGSVPDILADGVHCLLAEPRSPADLARCIAATITDGAQRRRRIAAAFELARGNTIEATSRFLVERLAAWVGESKRTNG
jgi:glycosyltransferase involved in cell wall biosynthesis